MLLDSSKYNISEERTSHYETVMYLTVKRWRKRDEGHFKCISKNSLGTADGRIQTYSKCLDDGRKRPVYIHSTLHLRIWRARSLSEMPIPSLHTRARFSHHNISFSLCSLPPPPRSVAVQLSYRATTTTT